MSEVGKPMWRCLAAGCTGGAFVEQNATMARFHAAQVKGGDIKVCNGVLDEQPFDALVTNLHRRNEKKEKTVHRALLSELAATTRIADMAVSAEQSVQCSSASRDTGVAIFPAVSRDEATPDELVTFNRRAAARDHTPSTQHPGRRLLCEIQRRQNKLVIG